ncbi:MAG: sigma-E processing peptidase SpoIIGA [Eubacteriales bacterium]|nr:sigma-E processing peptidase SpoIIGA [Eubacteriales bacterium]
MILYVDVYFFINFMMDLLILYLVRMILKAPGRAVRLAAGAAFGGAWACVCLLFLWMPLWLMALMSWGAAAAGMILIAFGLKRPAEFWRYLLTMWLVSLGAGGCFAALAEMGVLLYAGETRQGLLTLASLGLAGTGILFLGRAFISFLRQRAVRQEKLYQVTLHYKGRTKTLQALWDTGNQLYEPYSHQPVHVITYEAGREIFEKITGVVYIPFCSVGRERGLLAGVQADAMEVSQGGEAVRSYKKPWIAISREPLSYRHQYEMLLHGEQ